MNNRRDSIAGLFESLDTALSQIDAQIGMIRAVSCSQDGSLYISETGHTLDVTRQLVSEARQYCAALLDQLAEGE